jgi:murein DD-endopeptidase MepM/ murein hydrolase activator NlpD
MFNFTKLKLKEILFLQGFGDNPEKYTFLEVKGHIGIDINAGHLDPIYAFADGDVVYVSDTGDVVIIDDALEYTYSHLDNIQVQIGQKIKAGDLIGYQDSKGKSVLGEDWTHLHFSIRRIQRLSQKEPQNLGWNFPVFSPIPYKVLDTDNGFEGFIDPNLYCKKVIYRVAKAIEKYENMDKSYNNPGALRWSPFQSGTKNGFAVFNSYEDGFNALIHQLTIVADGRSKLYNPSMTVLDFCKVYAPSSDNNNPVLYAKFINDFCGFKGNEPISDWLLTEIEWIKKYNNVSKTYWVDSLGGIVRLFNKLWGLIWKN